MNRGLSNAEAPAYTVSSGERSNRRSEKRGENGNKRSGRVLCAGAVGDVCPIADACPADERHPVADGPKPEEPVGKRLRTGGFDPGKQPGCHPVRDGGSRYAAIPDLYDGKRKRFSSVFRELGKSGGRQVSGYDLF